MSEFLAQLDSMANDFIRAIEESRVSVAVLADDLLSQYRGWNELVVSKHLEIEQQAHDLGIAAPKWKDREEFRHGLQQLEAQRSIAPRRKRWQTIGEQLRAGRFVHRSPRKILH